MSRPLRREGEAAWAISRVPALSRDPFLPQIPCPAWVPGLQRIIPQTLHAAPRTGHDISHDFAISRHVSPELCKFVGPLQTEGAGKAGCRLTPAVSCAKLHIVGAHEHTGSAETARPSPRNGFTAYIALPPVSGLCCHRRRRDTSRQLSASIAAPGPHDFAVRLGVFVRRDHSSLTPKRPSHPAPHVS